MAAGPSSSSHRGTGVSSHSHMVAGGPCHSCGALSDPSAESVGTDTLSHLTALHTFPFSTNGTVPTSSVSVSNSNASGGQVVVNGTGLIFNFASPSNSAQASKEMEKPFVLKLKTKQIRICQSCRKDYEGGNDTLGLVVARAERRLVSNLSTGGSS